MKKLAFLSLVLVIISSQLIAQNKYQVNTEISEVEWIGKKVTGQHSGTIQLTNGSYAFQNGLITGGEFVIDMQSIKITDIEDQEENAKLLGHLNSSDFFGVEEHSSGKLTIVKSEKAAENKLNVTANLELKGISKPIKMMVTLLQESNKMVAIGEVEVDRTAYGIRYGSGSFIDNLGDKAIKDNFTVKFKVAAVKN